MGCRSYGHDRPVYIHRSNTHRMGGMESCEHNAAKPKCGYY